ncbi:hypothetical protein GUJ93_ZPchr0011g27373 [Zizania palustris]|uniref:Uncharacterized protein n=1 Tax=Zizania palustris TaxID=103762 RepID=A0A8J5WGH9_ZIZPA|nr:hypothetical protein GUJ93_ZPchr0011g27373 [Zizania palustris]
MSVATEMVKSDRLQSRGRTYMRVPASGSFNALLVQVLPRAGMQRACGSRIDVPPVQVLQRAGMQQARRGHIEVSPIQVLPHTGMHWVGRSRIKATLGPSTPSRLRSIRV